MRATILGCGSTNCTCVYNAEMAREALDRRDAEIERLRAENAKLKSTDMAVAMTEMSLRDEIVRLRSRVAELEEALKFYAWSHSWKSTSVYMCGHNSDSRATIDGGAKARAALEVKP